MFVIVNCIHDGSEMLVNLDNADSIFTEGGQFVISYSNGVHRITEESYNRLFNFIKNQRSTIYLLQD